MRFIQFRSAPAQKAVPLPASTTHRTSGRLPSSRNTAMSSVITSSLNALRTSGRLSVTVVTPAVVSRSRCFMESPLLAPDDGAVHRVQLARDLGVAFATHQGALVRIGRQRRVLGLQP